MKREPLTLASIEFVGAAASAITACLTAINPRWIESLFSLDPDGGSGSLEWAIVALLLAISLTLALLARRHWLRPNLGS